MQKPQQEHQHHLGLLGPKKRHGLPRETLEQKKQKEIRALHEKRRMGRDFSERRVFCHCKCFLLCQTEEPGSPSAALRTQEQVQVSYQNLVSDSWLGGSTAGGSVLHGRRCC